MVIDLNHVGMGDGGRGLGFPDEAGVEAGIVGVLGPEDLDGDLALEEGIGGDEGLGEAPLAKAAAELVALGQEQWPWIGHPSSSIRCPVSSRTSSAVCEAQSQYYIRA